MIKRKITAICLTAAMVISAAALTSCGNKTDSSTSSLTAADSAPAKDGESSSNTKAEVYTPTFMYFVSASDAEYDKETALVEELKTEYGDKIKFDIHNIDETPEDKENFPVDGQTPALIMLDTSNNISAMEFKCADKDKLKSNIDNALAGKTGE